MRKQQPRYDDPTIADLSQPPPSYSVELPQGKTRGAPVPRSREGSRSSREDVSKAAMSRTGGRNKPAEAAPQVMPKAPNPNERPPLFILLRPFGWMVDKVVNLVPIGEADRPDSFAADADVAMIQQKPLRAHLIMWSMLIVMILSLFWASWATLNEVTRGNGKVVPSKKIQIIESLDGGTVLKIHVSEGQQVQKGDLLVQIDSTRVTAGLKETVAQELSLKAKAARLRALANNQPFVAPEDVISQDANLITQEQLFYNAKKQELESQVSASKQQLVQREQELNDAINKRDSSSLNYDLLKREVDANRPLVETGAVSPIELLRLEREANRALAERDSAKISINRAESAIKEANEKIKAVESGIRNDAARELSETEARLKAIEQSSVRDQDKVKQSAIKSPVNGTVKRLLINTEGGVVSPGKPIMEIVPTDDEVLLEVQVTPRDIAYVRQNQAALIKFTAYDYTIHGGMDAKVVYISADTITDEKGNAFYLVRLKTDQPTFKNKPITAGMQVEADIKTGQKTVLNYLLKPALKARSQALTEH